MQGKKYWAVRGFGVLFILFFTVWLWTYSARYTAHWTPPYAMENIEPLLALDSLASEQYWLLYTQTGLGRAAIEQLLAQGKTEQILITQQAFFTIPTISCEKNSPISWEEHAIGEDGQWTPAAPLAPLEDGDILITPNSHTFGWRNGHAAIVVDAQQGLTLESVALGEVSTVQRTEKWESFPSFLVLRPAGLSAEQRRQAASYALEELVGVPYGFTIGIFSDKYTDTGLRQTHCAHLVWAAYRRIGIDLDVNGGRIVTPRQIALSGELEVVQAYGMDPELLWR